MLAGNNERDLAGVHYRVASGVDQKRDSLVSNTYAVSMPRRKKGAIGQIVTKIVIFCEFSDQLAHFESSVTNLPI